jgi:predicted PurR-regulated permease PerM
VIFCFLAGAVLFGVVGVILAVPAALIVKIVLSELYGEDPQDDKREHGESRAKVNWGEYRND